MIVICDVAPSEWMNPAWMHPYQAMELYPMSGNGLAENWLGFAADDVETSTGYNGGIHSSFERNTTQGRSHEVASSELYSGSAGYEAIGQAENQYNVANFGSTW
jgi:hypothetical protein